MTKPAEFGYERMFSIDFAGCSYIRISFLSLTICTTNTIQSNIYWSINTHKYHIGFILTED